MVNCATRTETDRLSQSPGAMQPAQKIADLALLVGGKARQPSVGLLHELRDGVSRFGCAGAARVGRGYTQARSFPIRQCRPAQSVFFRSSLPVRGSA